MKNELKEIKTELIEIEKRIIEDFKLTKINSSNINRYCIKTIYGNYLFYFDIDSIIGYFEDIKNYQDLITKYEVIKGVLYNKKHNINPNSGKFNFHYFDIYDFEYELYQIVIQ